MKRLLKENNYFFIPYLLFLLCCGVLLRSFTKPDLHILLNKFNSSFFDQFFRFATFLGNGVMIAVFVVVLAFFRYRYAVALLIGSLATSLVVNLFKKVLLHDMYRPSKYFELYETYKLHLVEGVKLHSLQSFPSGHTATAFNLFLMFALIVSNKYLKLLFLVMAVVVAWSRVYLSQHFVVDITAGSIVGVAIIFLTFWWVEKWNKNWIDKSLTDLFKPAK